MSDKALLFIHGFGTEWVPDKKNPGKMKPRDWAEYSPLGQAQRTVIKEWIELLECVQPLTGQGGQNPAVEMANTKWGYIKPRYEAWKSGQEVTEEGTPLAAWNGIPKSLTEVLKTHGVKTVDALAALTDAHKQAIGIMGIASYIENARRFLLAQDSNKVAASLEQKDAEIADLKAQMAELVDMVKEAVPKRRGRPPKQAEAAA